VSPQVPYNERPENVPQARIIDVNNNGGTVRWNYPMSHGTTAQVREHSSAVERCGPHVAISPAMVRSSNDPVSHGTTAQALYLVDQWELQLAQVQEGAAAADFSDTLGTQSFR